MAYVYVCKGLESPWKDLVAVKRLKPQFLNDSRISLKFLRECFIWMKLGQHPNIVSAFSAHAVAPETPMVTLDYYRRNLRDFLSETPFTERQAADIALDICAGLAFARQIIPGFVHADLKPENIMIDEEGRGRVTDFGLSRFSLTQSLQQTAIGAAKEDVGTVEGTIMYMAPEQIRGEQIHPATDVYALGCILFEMITRKALFHPILTPREYVTAHLTQRPPLNYLSKVANESGLTKIIEKCLQKIAGERFVSVEELREHLLNVELGETSTRPPLTELRSATSMDMARAATGLFNLGFFDDALATYRSALIGAHDEMSIFFLKTRISECLYRLGGYRNQTESLKMIRALNSYADKHTDSSVAAAYFQLGSDIFLEVNSRRDALEWTRNAVKSAPKSSVALANLAKAEANVGNLDAAHSLMLQAITISPNLIYFHLAVQVLFAAKRFDLAFEAAQKGLRVHPDCPSLTLSKAKACGHLAIEDTQLDDDEQYALLEAGFEFLLEAKALGVGHELAEPVEKLLNEQRLRHPRRGVLAIEENSARDATNGDQLPSSPTSPASSSRRSASDTQASLFERLKEILIGRFRK